MLKKLFGIETTAERHQRVQSAVDDFEFYMLVREDVANFKEKNLGISSNKGSDDEKQKTD